MNIFNRIISGIFKSRDKPQNALMGSMQFFFGRSAAGQTVNERTAMQVTAVYACVRILSESIAGLPLHVYRYKDQGKEMVPGHPLYPLLHDEPNPEMTSFIFRETLMGHLLLYGNAYAQIIRDGYGRVKWLYPLVPDRMDVNRDKDGQLVYRPLPPCATSSSPNATGMAITAASTPAWTGWKTASTRICCRSMLLSGARSGAAPATGPALRCGSSPTG